MIGPERKDAFGRSKPLEACGGRGGAGCVQEPTGGPARASGTRFQPLRASPTQQPGTPFRSSLYRLDHAGLLLVRCPCLSPQTHYDVPTLSPVCVSDLLPLLPASSPPVAPRAPTSYRRPPPLRTLPSGSRTSLFCVATLAYAALSPLEPWLIIPCRVVLPAPEFTLFLHGSVHLHQDRCHCPRSSCVCSLACLCLFLFSYNRNSRRREPCPSYSLLCLKSLDECLTLRFVGSHCI